MTENSMRQGFELEPEELAYLLGLVSAGPVMGLHADEFENVDPAAGEDRLRANGWMSSSEDGSNLNNAIFLAVAVMADPERAVAITRHLESGEIRSITVFCSGSNVISLFRTHSGYSVTTSTQLDDLFAVSNEALSGIEQHDSPGPAVRVSASEFKAASVERSTNQNTEPLQEVLSADEVDAETSKRWAEAIDTGTATASLQAFGFLGRQPFTRKDIYCFGSPGVLVAGDSRPDGTVLVSDFSQDRLAMILELVWTSIDPATAAAAVEEVS